MTASPPVPPESEKGVRTRPTPVSFSAVFLLSVLLCLTAALVLNLVGNGTNLFPSPGFQPSTCMRAWKARRLERLASSPAPPRTLVIGSSRVIPLEQVDIEKLTGEPAFNLGVSVGCPVDALAQLRLALSLGMHPSRIILGIDELEFGDNLEADFYDMQLLTNAMLFRQLDFRDQLPIVIDALKTVNVHSTIDSARNLSRRWWGPTSPAPDQEPPDSALEGMNMSAKQPSTDAERQAHLVAGIDRLVAFWTKYLDRPDKIDGMRPTRHKLKLLDDFLALTAKNGIPVTVVLLPVHPEFERRAFPPPVLAIREELGETLAERCRRYGCHYYDYTNLTTFGGNPREFADGTHMTPAGGRRMLEAIFTAAPGRSNLAPP